MAVNGVDIGKAYVQIVPSAENIEKNLTSLLGGETDKAGKKSGDSFAKKFAGTLRNVVATLGVGKMLADTINAGAALQQSIGGIETLFGANGAKNVAEYAELVKKPISEVAEEYSRLKASEQRAFEYANQAYKTTGLSANDYMQTVTSFAAALKNSTGSEIEAVEAANKAAIAMADNANKMGTDMASIQNAYMGFAKQNYTMLDNLKLGYGGTKTEMQRLLKDAEKLTGIKYDIDNLSDVYSAISVIQDQLGITGTTAREAEQTISGSFASMKAAFTDFLGNLTLGADITPSLEALISSTSTFLFNNLIPAVVNIVSGLGPAVATVFQGFYPQLEQRAVNIIDNFTNWLGNGFPKILQKGMELLQTLVQGIMDRLPEIYKKAGEVIGTFARAILENLPTILQKGIEIMANLLAGVLQAVPGFFTSVFNAFKDVDWLSIGSNIVDGIINGLKNGASRLWQAAKDLASSAWRSAKDFLGIHSPSKKFMYLGQMSMEGLADGLNEGSSLVYSVMDGITNELAHPVDVGALSVGRYSSSAPTAGFTQVVNNYSPKALSPSETARQTRNATRQLALKMSMGG